MNFDSTSRMQQKNPLRSCQEVWLMENAPSHMHVIWCSMLGFFHDHKSTARVYVCLFDALYVDFSCWLVIL